MIEVNNKLLGTKPKNSISIVKGTPLSNPFLIGHQNCIDGSFIMDRQGVQMAYMDWLKAQIKLENPVVINALDDIGYAVLEGQTVTLACTCNQKTCHGYVIKDIVEGVLNEHDPNSNGSQTIR